MQNVIDELNEKLNKTSADFLVYSLGDQNSKQVLNALLNAMKEGNWILIDNCHMSVDFIFHL